MPLFKAASASLIAYAAVAVTFFILPTAQAADHIVTIDPAQSFQTIRGWEVSDRVWQTDKKADRYDASWEALSTPLARALVVEAGINNLRLQVPSGIENPVDNWARFTSGEIGYQEMKTHLYEVVNDNVDPNSLNPAGFQFSVLDQNVKHVLIPMRDALAAQGERLYVTLNFVDFAWTDGSTELQLAKHPDEYAEFVLTVFQHLDQTYGIVPDALEIILEPENTDGWDGPSIGRAILAATDRLAAAGYSPAIIAPSTTRAENAVKFFNGISRIPGAAERVSMLSYHRYGPRTRASLPGIVQAAAAAGIQTGMLEYTKGDIDMLFEDLTVGNVSAWQQYGVARKVVDGDARASASYYLEAFFQGDALERIALAKRTRLMAEVFRLFRSGAVRIGATSDSIAAIAMRRPDGQYALALRVRDAGPITLIGMPVGDYLLSGMTETGEAIAPQNVSVIAGKPLGIASTGKGVLTLRPVP